MASFTQRMIGAARLSVPIYEEIEADRGATSQSLLVVVLTGLAAAVGGSALGGVRGPVLAGLAALIGWFVWAFIVWLVGTKILPEPQTEADLGQLLRTTGFSASPGILRVFGFIPIFGKIVDLVVSVWMLVAMVVAVRQALDYRGTGRAVGVCLIGFLIYLAATTGLALLLGGGKTPGV